MKSIPGKFKSSIFCFVNSVSPFPLEPNSTWSCGFDKYFKICSSSIPKIGESSLAVFSLSTTCCGFFGFVVLSSFKIAIILYEETFWASVSPSDE